MCLCLNWALFAFKLQPTPGTARTLINISKRKRPLERKLSHLFWDYLDQLAASAKLCNEIVVVARFQNVIHLHYIRVAHLLHQLSLSVQIAIYVAVFFSFVLIDDFNSDLR